MKNFSHGNDHILRRRLRKENAVKTLKTGTNLQEKLARSDSARAIEETMPLCILNEHVHLHYGCLSMKDEYVEGSPSKRLDTYTNLDELILFQETENILVST